MTTDCADCADLIAAVEDPELLELGTHSIVEDFRTDFPGTDDYARGGGNHAIAREMENRIPESVRDQLVIDPEFSCLYAYGPHAALNVALTALGEMKKEGWGGANPAVETR